MEAAPGCGLPVEALWPRAHHSRDLRRLELGCAQGARLRLGLALDRRWRQAEADGLQRVRARLPALELEAADGRLAAGAAQLLEDSGAAADVSVLEGGLQAWEWDAEELGDESMLPPLVIDEDGEGGLVGAWV